ARRDGRPGPLAGQGAQPARGTEARARGHSPQEPARARRHAGRRAHPRAARARLRAQCPGHRHLAGPHRNLNTMATTRFDFSGRVVVVTGAANGIGAACARLFAASGAKLALWDVDVAAGQALAAELGGDARPICCDVSSRGEVEAAIATIPAVFGRIDVLINNAGIFRAADFLDITE